MAMKIVINPNGSGQCVYSEEIDLASLGNLRIRRGSHVEPTAQGEWTVDLSPVGGPILGPCNHRKQALRAEVRWLEKHWLSTSPPIIDAVSETAGEHQH